MTDSSDVRTIPTDIAVIGGGLAGLTAGLFAARHGRSTLVFNSLLPGGQLLNISHVDDFPGFPDGISGFELCPAIQNQAMRWGAEFAGKEARALNQDSELWTVTDVDGEPHQARVVIVATGSSPRMLDIPGEAELVGRGVSQCASCDGPLYRDQIVGVVGGGDSAVQETLDLANSVAKVVLFHRGGELTAQAAYRDALNDLSNVEIRYNAIIEKVLGGDKVAGIIARDVATDSTHEIALAALFVYIGSTPNSTIVRGLVSLDADGRVVTDESMRTSARGLLAAGDVRRDSVSHAVTAAGDGATAATIAHRYLVSGVWTE